MLYIIKSYRPYKGGLGYIYKVGFTNNIHSRYLCYIGCNPYCELVSTREGDLELEIALHFLLSEKGYKLPVRKEWYIGDPEVLRIFHWPTRKILNYSKPKALNINKKELEKDLLERAEKELDNLECLNFIHSFYETNLFVKRMKLYCEFMDNSDDSLISKTRPFIDDKYWSYYTFYGTKGCSARYYNEKRLIIGMRDRARLPQKIEMIYDVFKEGETYIKKDIKLKLKEIDKILGIESSSKATDLFDFFEIKAVQVKSSGGKREHAFKLINRRNI